MGLADQQLYLVSEYQPSERPCLKNKVTSEEPHQRLCLYMHVQTCPCVSAHTRPHEHTHTDINKNVSTHIFLKTTCSVCIMILVCMASGPTIWH